MKKTLFVLFTVLVFTAVACTASSQTINSAEALKEYLDKQPANSPDKPIRVTMAANLPMLPNIVAAINSAGKYVSLNLSGNALTAIPESAFYNESTEKGCTLLIAITIPNSVTSIGDSAFFDCTNLASVTIPSSVTSIGDEAFWGCTGLTSVAIPNSVKSIGAGAFNNCTGLTSVTIPNNVKTIDWGTFMDCKSLTSVTIPNSVTRIWNEAFHGCTGLTSITIPNSVTYIGDYAFTTTSLTSVTIPSSVTSIGRGAFNGCRSLTSVKFEGTISSRDFDSYFSFLGDLRAKYLAGGVGTYTRPNGDYTWTKQ